MLGSIHYQISVVQLLYIMQFSILKRFVNESKWICGTTNTTLVLFMSWISYGFPPPFSYIWEIQPSAIQSHFGNYLTL